MVGFRKGRSNHLYDMPPTQPSELVLSMKPCHGATSAENGFPPFAVRPDRCWKGVALIEDL
jgi:hypothetical protein